MSTPSPSIYHVYLCGQRIRCTVQRVGRQRAHWRWIVELEDGAHAGPAWWPGSERQVVRIARDAVSVELAARTTPE